MASDSRSPRDHNHVQLWNKKAYPKLVSGLASGVEVLNGRYRLERPLGSGGTGYVWLALDTEIHAKRSLKFLSDHLHRQPGLHELEVVIAQSKKLTHQNIVRIYDFIRGEHHSAIAFEFVDGPDMKSYIENRKSVPFEVSELNLPLFELCCALHYAHAEANMLHRDLKPSNLLINSRGQLKLSDFGISQAISAALGNLSDTGDRPVPRGALDFMSPQLLEAQEANSSDDIFSFGATAYYLLTGRPPYYHGMLETTEAPSIAAGREEMGHRLTPVPPAWEETIAACLDHRPENRPQSFAEIVSQMKLEANRPEPKQVAKKKVNAPAKKKAHVVDRDRKARRIDDLLAKAKKAAALRPQYLRVAGIGLGALILLLIIGKLAKPDDAESKNLTAEEATQKKQKDEVTDVDKWHSKAKKAEKKGDLPQAMSFYGKIIRSQGDKPDPKLLLKRGNLRLLSNLPREASLDFGEILQKNPEIAEAIKGLALSHFQQKQYGRVIRESTEALALLPNDKKLFEIRAFSHLKTENPRDAIKDFSTIITLDPEDPSPHYHRGRAQMMEDNLEAAYADFDQALAKGLTDHEDKILYIQSLRAMEQGRWESAHELLSRVISLNQDHEMAYYNRVLVNQKQGDQEMVIADSSLLLMLKPEWEELHFYRANAYWEMDQPEHAIHDMGIAIDINPTVENYQKRVDAFLAAKDYKRALADLDSMVALGVSSSQTFGQKARIHYVMGNLKTAVNDSTDALQLNSKNKEALEIRADSRFRLGQYWESLRDYRTLLALSSGNHAKATARIKECNYHLSKRSSKSRPAPPKRKPSEKRSLFDRFKLIPF